MNTKNNKRSQDSVKRLSWALLDLTEKYPSEKITVRQLCKEAGVNRSTFYAHFRDIYDVVEKAESFLLEELRDDLDQQCGTRGITPDQFLAIRLAHIRKHHHFINKLQHSGFRFPSSNALPLIAQFLQTWVIEPQCRCAGIDDVEEIAYYTICFQSGHDAMLRRWVDGGCKETDQWMQKILKNCMPQIQKRDADSV